MAKKRYHLPLHRVRDFIQTHKSDIRSILHDTLQKEYSKRFAKAQYLLELERFLNTFHITKDLPYALKLLSYFESEGFYEMLCGLLGLGEMGEKNKASEVLLILFSLLYRQNEALYVLFLEHTFIHYYTEQTAKSKIHIDYQSIAKHLAKQQNLELKESFGVDGEIAFFRIYTDGELLVGKEGKSIKTLRKQVYKILAKELMN
jgi:hypothetical protein